MKSLAVIGAPAGSGQSWIATALCAWLRGEGVRVAPFRPRSVSNSYWATLDGGEIARAQVVQAEACGLAPITAMNPLLLKPSGEAGAQILAQDEATSVVYGMPRVARELGAVEKILPVWALGPALVAACATPR